MGQLSTFNLSKIQKHYELEHFLETGTFQGDGLAEAAVNPYKNIYSIDIDQEYCDKAKLRFAHDSRIDIRCGPSNVVLEELLGEIEGNCFFWLDAHFPGADGNKERYDAVEDDVLRIPMREELALIQSRAGQYRDVILADDIWIYGESGYDFGDIDEYLEKQFPDMQYSREQLSGGQTLAFVDQLFAETHYVEKVPTHAGYLLLLPKSKPKINWFSDQHLELQNYKRSAEANKELAASYASQIEQNVVQTDKMLEHIENYETVVENQQSAIESLSESNEKYRELIDTYQGYMKTHQETINTYQGHMETYQGHMEMYQETINTMNGYIENYQKIVSALETE